MPRSVTVMSTDGVVPGGPDDDRGALGGVRDGVGHQVADGDGDLLAVAEQHESFGAVVHQLDLPCGGVGQALVDGAGDDLVGLDGDRLVERVVALQPGELDDLLHQPGEALALGVHAAGEALHGLGVVGGVDDGVGEQLDRAHRRLQLVADVGHEVAADRLDPALAGAVLDERQDELAAQRRDPGGHVARRHPVALHEELGLADLPVASYLPDQLAQLAHGDLVTPHETHRDGGRGGLQDGVATVDDEGRAAQHGEDGGHARREGRLGRLGGPHLSFAHPERQYGATAQHCSEQREEEGLDCRAHAFDRTQGFIQGWLLGLVLTGLFTFDSRNDANTSPGRRRLTYMRDAYADQLDSIRDDLVT